MGIWRVLRRRAGMLGLVVVAVHCTPAPPEATLPSCRSRPRAAENIAAGEPEPRLASVAEVQGAAHRSALVDRYVQVTGVVTVLGDGGFHLQSEVPDQDPATSEGLFVATSERQDVLPGDRVTVAGRVVETRPGCSGCGPEADAFYNLTQTEIALSHKVRVEASGAPLPAPTIIGLGGRRPPAARIDSGARGDVEANDVAAFDPCADGIDFYESLEHMLVRIDAAHAVGPTTDAGVIAVVGDGGRYATGLTPRGGLVVRPDDANPERVLIDNAIVHEHPSVDVGARFVEPIVGVLGYAHGSYRLFNTLPLIVEGATDLRRERLALDEPRVDELDLATLNVENLSAADTQERFAGLAMLIVGTLMSPDVLVLQEVQDDSGSADDGVVTSVETLSSLALAIERVGGPLYQFADIAPIDQADGGQPGGNVRVAFMVSPRRGARLVLRARATATTPNEVVSDDDSVGLRFSPGRIDPTNAAFTSSRKPLAAEISFRGATIVVIGNHFTSKASDEPLYGRWQPPTLVSEAKRQAQARVVAGFVSELTAADPALAVVVAGDFNDFEFSGPLATLERAGLINGLSSLSWFDRYTYVFEGNSQALDHVLLSEPVLRRGFEYDIVHANAEFHDGLSDHDPSVVRLRLQ